MSTSTKIKPDGFQNVVPSLTIQGAAEAIDFYKNAFAATERYRLNGQDGKQIMHAEIEIGGCVIMISDEFKEWGCLSPKSLGGSPSLLRVYVEDVDAAYQQAVSAGATGTQEPRDQFWGERSAELTDPFGHRWSLGRLQEELTPEEMEVRFKKFMSQLAE